MMRTLITLIILSFGGFISCANYDCDTDFYKNFFSCRKNIKDLNQFKEIVTYFEVEKINGKLTISRFSKGSPELIQNELIEVVQCMDSDKFEHNNMFKIIYMHLHLNNLEKEGYKESLAEKIKKDNNIKGKTCLIWSGYGSRVR